MASCKDCVHFEVCISYVREAYKRAHLATPDLNSFRSLRGDNCEHFKDRSRFVELPFQIGDDVYCTRMFKIYKKTVKEIELDDEGIAVVTEDGYCYDLSICFRSQKEAEQALKLKERENSV